MGQGAGLAGNPPAFIFILVFLGVLGGLGG
jgi:hypothetical protein